MTDNDTLADCNIKDFGKLTRYVLREQGKEYLTAFEPITSCQDRICIQCTYDHSFRGNFEDTITFIDLLPELFPETFKSNKLQEFVN
jgi:hypothetical protein